MALPTREEIIAYAREVARRHGLDEETFLTVIEKESGFDPAAIGDNGQSHGLAQLFMGGGEGNVYQEKYGEPPGDPTKWMRDLDFMGERVATGGTGYKPWHAAANAGIEDFQGVPGHNTTNKPGWSPGKKPMLATTGPSPTGISGQPQKEASLTDMFGMTPEERLEAWNPKGAHTVAGKVTDLLGITDPEARKYDYKGKKGRPQSLLAAAFDRGNPSNPYAEDEDQKLLDKFKGDNWNPMAPVSDERQAAAIQAKKKPQTLAGFFLNPKEREKSPNTLLGMLGFG